MWRPVAGLDARTRESLLWGVVGGLAFLASIQGYQLATAERVAPAVILGVTLLVTAVAAALSHAVRPRAGGSERD